ncbi:MAG: DNA polymerase III subunit gamma/tau [Nitrospiraceae bacterium]|nr:DNA polymerase III subunit gamma/tau [Nitrospiraceae bacterium]
MGYLVLARKWRPSGFGDLVGQEPVARILGNSILQGKIAHAYIFSGPRGVGKTSTARILARALNCEDKGGPTPEPCGKCNSCLAIAGGSSMDVLEIDGASNNGVGDIRELREMVKYAPSSVRYKVYIIDEAHMLSESAFNALLKTLEEPPAHVVFVMATTEPRKIPLTVFSRCQHLPFRRISAGEIRGRLERIAASEGLKMSPGSLEMISRAADGSMRDSLTILDQMASVSNVIDEELVRELLGITDHRSLSALTEAVLADDKVAVLSGIAGFADKGADLRQVLKDLIRLARDLLVFRLSKKPQEALESGEEEMRSLEALSAIAAEEQILALLSELLRAEPELRFSSNPRFALEITLLKAAYFKAFLPVKEVLQRLGGAAPEPARGKPGGPSGRPSSPSGPGLNSGENIEANAGANESPAAIKSSEAEPVSEPVSRESAGEKTDTPKPRKTAGDILALLAEKAEGPLLKSALESAEGRVEDGKLVLSFNDINPELLGEQLERQRQRLSEEASALFGAPIDIHVSGGGEKRLSKKDLFRKAQEHPFTREALELFDGKIVDVKEIGG